MEGGVMSLERKGHSAGFDMVVRGEGRFEVHELGKFFKNRMFVITFHALNLDARSMPSHQCLIRMKKLLEILTYYSVSWERLELTQFHTISLEAFFTGGESPNRLHPSKLSNLDLVMSGIFGGQNFSHSTILNVQRSTFNARISTLVC